MRRITLIILSAIVLGILFVVLCTFVRRPYEQVLLYRFGNILEDKDQTRLMYNWYLKLPTDSVIRIDTRLHLYTGPLQQMVTGSSETISVQTYAAWRIVDARKFYNTTNANDSTARGIIDRKLSGLVQAQIANHRLEEIFNTDETKVQTPAIETEVARESTEGSPDGKISGVTDQGLEVVQVGFSRMAFPPNNAQSVYLRMAEERKTEAAKYLSEGRSQADSIRAQGTAQAKEIRAQAVAEAERIRGEGDHNALEILAGVQKSDAAREFYQYWKSMEFIKGAFTKNTILVLPSSDPLKALLNSVNGQTPTAPAGATLPAAGTPSPQPSAPAGMEGAK